MLGLIISAPGKQTARFNVGAMMSLDNPLRRKRGARLMLYVLFGDFTRFDIGRANKRAFFQ